MFILTAKVNAKKVIACILALAAVACAVMMFSGSQNAPAVNANTSAAKVKTNEERIGFLKALGIQPADDPAEFMEIKIPDKFDQVFERYNSIQLEQGYDLSKYTGRRVMRYTYDISNHTSGQAARANLLIYKDTVIGGDVCSVELGGFMHRLGISDNSANG